MLPIRLFPLKQGLRHPAEGVGDNPHSKIRLFPFKQGLRLICGRLGETFFIRIRLFPSKQGFMADRTIPGRAGNDESQLRGNGESCSHREWRMLGNEKEGRGDDGGPFDVGGFHSEASSAGDVRVFGTLPAV